MNYSGFAPAGLLVFGLITGFTAYNIIVETEYRERGLAHLSAALSITSFLLANPFTIEAINKEGIFWVAGHWVGAASANLLHQLNRR